MYFFCSSIGLGTTLSWSHLAGEFLQQLLPLLGHLLTKRNLQETILVKVLCDLEMH
jgi:hypothetical protein